MPFLNVVFDLGGVVVTWQPREIIRRVFQDSKSQELVHSEIFGHADWVELDRGTLDADRAIDRGAERTGLRRADIVRLFQEIPPSLTLIQETIDLIRTIKSTGNRLFVLSNMHFASIAYLEENHDFWDMFDGIVVSCRVRKVKPELEMYEHLLSAYQLEATDTVFIDDMHENLEAAAKAGIQTIRFLSPSQCRQDLVNLNFIE